ncbi:unnamed protein product [Ceratitis capitata]|uniref:(Mediterranean fruit fly) hypothetical protein n=1 Tax=Ceratitis capitata TaxID=7213 RepID=A0A811TZA9_CERCA|nr:unnamed protein product [Ceratitis capitata]
MHHCVQEFAWKALVVASMVLNRNLYYPKVSHLFRNARLLNPIIPKSVFYYFPRVQPNDTHSALPFIFAVISISIYQIAKVIWYVKITPNYGSTPYTYVQ